MFATPPESSLVEVSLTPDDEGTIVQLVHRRLDPQALAVHRAGWNHYLQRLALAATGADAGVDPWRSFETARRDLRAAGVSLGPDPRIL